MAGSKYFKLANFCSGYTNWGQGLPDYYSQSVHYNSIQMWREVLLVVSVVQSYEMLLYVLVKVAVTLQSATKAL